MNVLGVTAMRNRTGQCGRVSSATKKTEWQKFYWACIYCFYERLLHKNCISHRHCFSISFTSTSREQFDWFHSGRILRSGSFGGVGILSNNRLSGRLPILDGPSPLKRIEWEKNDMEDSIPLSYVQMLALTSLNIAGNKLSGSLPGGLQFLTNSEELTIYKNSLAGTIPAGLLFLTNLATLTLSNNQLSGSIPEEVLRLNALKEVDLSHNRLSGSLPSVLGANLERFAAFSNSLNGTFPWTTPSPLLEWVRLSGNRLTGTLPWTDIAKFPLLAVIEMLGNELTGGLEEAMGQLTTMKMIEWIASGLTGTIPASIGNMTKLRGLRLGGNQLSGTLPSELGDLKNHEALILNDNYDLNGTIPTALAELVKLGKSYMFYMMAGYGAV